MKIETIIRLFLGFVFSLIPAIALKMSGVEPNYFNVVLFVLNGFIQGVAFMQWHELRFYKDILKNETRKDTTKI